MFNNINVVYDEKKEFYKVTGFLGTRFKKALFMLLGVKKTNAMFIEITPNSFKFYAFFLLEVYRTIEELLTTGSTYATNLQILNKFLSYVNTEIWSEQKIDTHLDKSMITDKMNFKILKHQEPAFDKYEIYKDKLGYRGLLFAMATGTGKALRFTTPVLTPTGWKKIYKLEVGDTVIGQDGKPTNVIGVYPQGKRQLYRLTFADGRTIDADGEHLWSIRSHGKKVKNPVTVLELIAKLSKFNSKTSRIYIPLLEPDYTEIDKPVLVDPYLLGALIGDGGLTVRVSLHNPDKEIIDKCKKILGSDYKFTPRNDIDHGISYSKQKHINPLKEKLDLLGLFGKTSLKKFIPETYFTLSPKQRLHLLQGLLDTDGYVDKSGSVSYSTPSKRLVNDVIRLVRSLGGMAYYNIKYPMYTYGGKRLQGQPNYNINIRIKNAKDCLTLSKKKDRLKDVNQYSETLSLRLDKIEKIDSADAVCIAVDNKDKLFVTKDYIVTHNTFTSLALAESLHSDKVIIIAPNQTIDKVWTHSLKDEIYKKPQSVFVVNRDTNYSSERFLLTNYESIDKLNAFLTENDFTNATIIIDESHNFANEISKRTKALVNVLDKVKSNNILMMSGTPIKAYSKELGVIMKILDTRFNSVIEKRFIKLYKTPTKLLKTILPERFGEYSVKVKKETLDLEPVITRYVSLKIKDGNKYTLENIKKDLRVYIEKRTKELTRDFDLYTQTYNDLYNKAKSIALLENVKEKEFVTYEKEFKIVVKLYKQNKLAFHPEVVKSVNVFERDVLLPRLSGTDKKDFREAKTVVKYMLLKLQGEALANVIMRARIECHKDIAANLSYSKIVNSTTKKTIVFSNYIEVCSAAEQKTINENLKPITVYGNTSKNLSNAVTQFNSDPNTNPLITTYKSLSTGVPLIIANVIIALDVPFRMYIYEQAIARAWRLGQDKQVVVYIPELDTGDENNINGRNLDIISFYKDEVEQITGHSPELEISATDTISNEDYKYLIENNIYKPTVSKQCKHDVLTSW